MTIARGVTAHKIFPGAQETSNDALKAEGQHKKAVMLVKKMMYTMVSIDCCMQIHQFTCRGSNCIVGFSIRRLCEEIQQQIEIDIFSLFVICPPIMKIQWFKLLHWIQCLILHQFSA